MRLSGDALRLSASDLMRFKGCRHATTMDLRRVEIGDVRPGQDSAEALLLQRLVRLSRDEVLFFETEEVGHRRLSVRLAA